MTPQVKIKGLQIKSVLQHLVTILFEHDENLCHNWPDVCRRLDFSGLDIENLNLKLINSNQNIRELLPYIFNLWVSKVGEKATIENLIFILSSDPCPYNGAADRLRDYLNTYESSNAVNQSIVEVQEEALDTSIQIETPSGQVNGTYQALGNASENSKNTTKTSNGRYNGWRKRWPEMLFITTILVGMGTVLYVVCNIPNPDSNKDSTEEPSTITTVYVQVNMKETSENSKFNSGGYPELNVPLQDSHKNTEGSTKLYNVKKPAEGRRINFANARSFFKVNTENVERITIVFGQINPYVSVADLILLIPSEKIIGLDLTGRITKANLNLLLKKFSNIEFLIINGLFICGMDEFEESNFHDPIILPNLVYLEFQNMPECFGFYKYWYETLVTPNLVYLKFFESSVTKPNQLLLERLREKNHSLRIFFYNGTLCVNCESFTTNKLRFQNRILSVFEINDR